MSKKAADMEWFAMFAIFSIFIGYSIVVGGDHSEWGGGWLDVFDDDFDGN